MYRYDIYNLTSPQSDTVNAVSLAATTAKSDTIPVGARVVIITSSTTCYYKIGTGANVATIPTDTTNGTASELLPALGSIVRSLTGARTKGWITTGTALLTVDNTDGISIGDTLVVTGAGAAGVDLTQTVSSINQATKVVTLGGNASTTVDGAAVTETITQISVISPSTCIVTFAYYK